MYLLVISLLRGGGCDDSKIMKCGLYMTSTSLQTFVNNIGTFFDNDISASFHNNLHTLYASLVKRYNFNSNGL